MTFWHFHWNFYRIHLTFFIVHPLVWSAIFWGANGKYPVSFPNAMFLCYSAQTVTGLSTVNLSTVTGFQQAVLFYLMISGDATVVSWVVVMVRRYYFIRKCAYVIRKRKHTQSKLNSAIQLIRAHTLDVLNPGYATPEQLSTPVAQGSASPPSHIQEIESCRACIDVVEQRSMSTFLDPGAKMNKPDSNLCVSSPTDASTQVPLGKASERTSSPSAVSSHSHTIRDISDSMDPDYQLTSPSSGRLGPMPRTVGFVESTAVMSDLPTTARSGADFPRTTTNMTNRSHKTNRSGPAPSVSWARVASNVDLPAAPPLAPREHTSLQGFGGFPTPLTLGARLAKKVAPGVYGKLERKLTLQPVPQPVPLRSRVVVKSDISGPMPALDPAEGKDHLEIQSESRTERRYQRADASGWTDDLEALGEKVKGYVKQSAVWVGRNSSFHLDDLADEELKEVGGVEFGAIRVLSWLVPCYIIGTHLICFIIWASYLSSVHRYDSVIASQPRVAPVAWYSAFQAVSAFTGGGLSLVDMGMVPFLTAYPLVISLGFLIISGNMLMPVFLRGIVWIIYRVLPPRSRNRPYFRFLLDHPRRCFLYLFPSHQSWFLVAVFFFLTAIEWGGFLVFNIGLDVYDAIPTGDRFLAGWFQSLGVRASGFSIVSLGALAPACKLLYIIMMYISAYPIAMSLRSTNVYEERSLGVYRNRKEQDETEPQGEVFSKYFGWHVRRQLAFDLWWLAAAMLIINVIERKNLMALDNEGWFNQFSLLFEIVSAYATVGLSLGIPTENYSFSGALRTGSKIIIILVMIRGRHRELPVAIDRAIMLPEEFSQMPADSSGRNVTAENIAQQLDDEERMMDTTGSSRRSSDSHAAQPLPSAPVR